jgi:invasion protein IalB
MAIQAGETRSMRVAAFAVALIVMSEASALAQQQAPEPPAAWRVECAGDGKSLECRALQHVVGRDSRQLVASVSVRHVPDNKPPLLLIQLPLGLNLVEPVAIRVDSGAAERYPLQTCNTGGCFTSVAMSDALVAAMRTGTDLKVVFQDAGKKTIEIGFPLLGFGLAYDKAK